MNPTPLLSIRYCLLLLHRLNSTLPSPSNFNHHHTTKFADENATTTTQTVPPHSSFHSPFPTGGLIYDNEVQLALVTAECRG